MHLFHSFPACSLLLVPIMVLISLPLPARGASELNGHVYSVGITGRPSAPNHGWFEEMVYLSHKGAPGTGSADLSGEFDTPPQSNRGLFYQRIPGENFPGGRYALFTLGYDEVPGFDYVLDIDVPAGSNPFSHNLPVDADYSVMFDQDFTEWPGNSQGERWIWASEFYQTFVARGRHITRLATSLVQRNENVQNLSMQLVKPNGGPPSTWPAVLPERSKFIGNIGNDALARFIHFVPYHSSEVTLTPGETYALRVWTPDGFGSGYQFGIFARPDNGDGYAQGHAWQEDVARTDWDLFGFVTGGVDNNSLLNYAPLGDFQTSELLGFTPSFGQTFRATGEGLAAVEMTIALGGGGSNRPVTWQLYESVGGGPIGPAKTGWTGQVHPFLWRAGVLWHPGEANLTPGNTYYLEGTSSGVNLWNMNEGYAHGEAYLNRTPVPGKDILMSIAEYEFIDANATPTPSPSPTPSPTPVAGSNLLFNGNMEQGTPGTTNSVPDGWTRWTGAGDPTWWYGSYGNGTDGARLIGGSINGKTFDGGLVQRVDGLTPGHRYQLTGWVSVTPRNSGDHGGWVGVDLTGQTGNGLAASVAYVRTGGNNTFAAMDPQTVTATGPNLSVYLRAATQSTSEIFYADFDDFSLVDLGPATSPTPTPSPTPMRERAHLKIR